MCIQVTWGFSSNADSDSLGPDGARFCISKSFPNDANVAVPWNTLGGGSSGPNETLIEITNIWHQHLIIES